MQVVVSKQVTTMTTMTTWMIGTSLPWTVPCARISYLLAVASIKSNLLVHSLSTFLVLSICHQLSLCVFLSLIDYLAALSSTFLFSSHFPLLLILLVFHSILQPSLFLLILPTSETS